MQIASKVNGDTLSATEFNQITTELQTNLITTSGQTPASGTLDQVGIGVASYAGQAGVFTTDSGVADAYVLTQISPFKAPYSYKNGLTLRFRAGNANTGPCTVNAFGLGVKNIKLADGSTNPAANTITTASDTEITYDGTSFRLNIASNTTATTSISGSSLLPSQITISNNGSDASNDIDFSAGVFQFSDGSGQAVLSALTKRLDASWAAGTNQGGLDTGSKANSTWYYCYGIYKPTTSTADAIFSTSNSSPTLPSGYTKYRYVGAIRTDGSGNLLGFVQKKNITMWNNISTDLNTTSPATSKTNITLLIPNLPCLALLRGHQRNASGAYTLFYSSNEADSVPAQDNATMVSTGQSTESCTSMQLYAASSQIAYRCDQGSIDKLTLWTMGWIDLSIM